jgi:UDP-N-acetylmuramoylalanine--D-glutamate ligase
MLNVTQDHMDRYDSMAAYARAKERIFLHAKTRVVNRDDAWSAGMAAGERTFSFGLGVPKDDGEWGFDPSRMFMRRGSDNLMATSGWR